MTGRDSLKRVRASLFSIKHDRLALIVSVTVLLLLVGSDLLASESGLKSLINEAHTEIKSNLLKPVSKVGAMSGAVMAMFRAFTASGYGPVVMWGGTAVFASLLPTIIDRLFGV